MRLVLCLCLAAVLPLRADSLADLKARLRALNGSESLKASVDYQIWSRSGDVKKPVITQGKVTAWVEEGPQGLKIFWGRDLIQKAIQEARLQNTDPEKTTPTRRAMGSLGALDLEEYFNSGEKLLQDLEQATLVEEKSDTLDGKLVRLLSFKLEPRMSKQQRKYVKELDATAKLWVDKDGVPVGAEQNVKVKGKALLVISFQSEQHDEFRFARIGERLVTVSHIHEDSGSGGGESGASKQVTTLRYN